MLPPRLSNVALGVLLAVALVTGTLGFAVGTSWVRWVLAAHATAAVGLLILAPVKSGVIGRGWRRQRAGRWASAVMGTLVVVTVVSGFLLSAGWWPVAWPVSAVQVHVPAAIAGSALAVWHVAARPARVRREDASRRVLLRAGGILGLAGLGWLATEGLWRAAGAPGGRRRFTGSHRVWPGVVGLDAVPVTIWFDDTPPALDPARWRLDVRDAAGARTLRLRDLPASEPLTATLDCTSGWYAEVAWDAVPLRALLDPGDHRTIEVRSATGYARRFPVRDLDRLHLAIGAGGGPLTTGHGAPVRLVAPGRRGFQWVKWVVEVRTDARPWWLQAPFPLT